MLNTTDSRQDEDPKEEIFADTSLSINLDCSFADLDGNTPTNPEDTTSTTTESPRSKSNSTDMGGSEFNTLILLTIDSTKKNGEVTASFTTARPSTILGSTQGSHIIAHRLFTEFCAAVIKGGKLSDAAVNLKNALLDLEIIADFDSDLTPMNAGFVPYDTDMINFLKNNSSFEKDQVENFIFHYKTGVRKSRIDVIIKCLSDMMIRYNSLPDAVIPGPSTKMKSEGPDIRTALVALKAINTFLLLTTEEDKKVFYEKAILYHGEFVEGMAKIFERKNITEVRALLNQQNPIDAFIQAFEARARNPEIIGKLIEYFLDYPYENTRKADGLNQFINRAKKMIFKTFPEIAKLNQEQIKEHFLKTVFQKQGWSQSSYILQGIQILKNPEAQKDAGQKNRKGIN